MDTYDHSLRFVCKLTIGTFSVEDLLPHGYKSISLEVTRETRVQRGITVEVLLQNVIKVYPGGMHSSTFNHKCPCSEEHASKFFQLLIHPLVRRLTV